MSNLVEKKQLSVILPCFGRYEIIESYLKDTIKQLSLYEQYFNLVVVLDGIYWENVPLIRTLKTRFTDVEIITVKDETHLPAFLYNVGISRVKTPYVTFAWAGSSLHIEVVEKLNSIFATADRLEKVYYLNIGKPKKLPYYPNDALRYGWCQCEKIYEINHLFVSIEIFKEIGYFDESRIIQSAFDWDFIIRLARNYTFHEIMTLIAENKLTFDIYPFNKTFNVSKDIIHRYILRTKIGTKEKLDYNLTENELLFINDLPQQDRMFLLRNIEHEDNSIMNLTESKKKGNYKITIVSGLWDYVHNQLCFFNYLDKLYGKNFATYKVIFDFSITIDDIKDSDLVIFSRCRNPRIIDILKYCEANNINTLYMIDDNWLWVGKDWPEDYGHIFSPGKPDYDVFVEALKMCDATLVYNKYLEEDIKPYANKVYRIKVNVNLDFYNTVTNKTDEYLIIGYSGSLRYDNEAFKALAEVAKENKGIKVLIFGFLTSEQEELFKDVQLIKLEYKSYFEYCKQISSINPAILLAPLDNSRTSMSKCPNKYLEITAAGSVGIYSDVYPYNEIIKDNVNGLLVKYNYKEVWKEKILYLLQNKNVLEEIKRNSIADVKNRFSTDVVIEQFCEVINLVIRGE
ncbi:Glycosyltransferase involved in cell wall bisynthesis [Caloranaerobacter azorensis DSM 13643]|uniref:Glycosyltransferase involved in cell wall bisynthesis n=1 Tax=Caloranaerobacter azorensis DSM 13643 TaxID=1121264 RepID=A0A1M5SZZ3_9FIRM|nr:glycosyltransferase [Caloranaerobacter azorensis]SHH44036.1 Glycosyltransferase involved in cell wall bisynthesis [Caloranaerobacter azorensis DSM 13643]